MVMLSGSRVFAAEEKAPAGRVVITGACDCKKCAMLQGGGEGMPGYLKTRRINNQLGSSPAFMNKWLFKNGRKVVDGRLLKITATETYLSSNGVTIYTTTTWEDGTRSCNCPGWARKIDVSTGDRTCGHVRGEHQPLDVTPGRASSLPVTPQPVRGVRAGSLTGTRLVGREE